MSSKYWLFATSHRLTEVPFYSVRSQQWLWQLRTNADRGTIKHATLGVRAMLSVLQASHWSWRRTSPTLRRCMPAAGRGSFSRRSHWIFIQSSELNHSLYRDEKTRLKGDGRGRKTELLRSERDGVPTAAQLVMAHTSVRYVPRSRTAGSRLAQRLFGVGRDHPMLLIALSSFWFFTIACRSTSCFKEAAT